MKLLPGSTLRRMTAMGLALALITPLVAGCSNIAAFSVLTAAALTDFFLIPVRSAVGTVVLFLINNS